MARIMQRDFTADNGEVYSEFSNEGTMDHSAFWKSAGETQKPDAEPDFKSAQGRLRYDYAVETLHDAVKAVEERAGKLTVEDVQEITGLEEHLCWGIAKGSYEAFDIGEIEAIRNAFREHLKGLPPAPAVCEMPSDMKIEPPHASSTDLDEIIRRGRERLKAYEETDEALPWWRRLFR